ncbi:hypothetical protein D6825_02825 [Candidatus Woesearchaeota archaeon]|nr:MAG: hypothetical protein D6825_02825 [Candidatus Woesearchaeota archaeon]
MLMAMSRKFGRLMLMTFLFVIIVPLALAARLPIVGEDAGQWGSILNDFLNVSLAGNGSLRTGAVSGDTIEDGSITDEDISGSTNITTTGYGLFGSLGSYFNRVISAFVQDLDVSGKIVLSSENSSLMFASSNAKIASPSVNNIILSTSGVERVRVSDSGNVGIGTFAPATLLHAKSSLDGEVLTVQDVDGDCRYSPELGGVSLSCLADKDLMHNISYSPKMSEYLTGIPVSQYVSNLTGKVLIGVAAQDLVKEYSELVRSFEGKEYVRLPNVWMLIAALKEQQDRIDELESDLEDAEDEIDTIKKELCDNKKKSGKKKDYSWC